MDSFHIIPLKGNGAGSFPPDRQMPLDTTAMQIKATATESPLWMTGRLRRGSCRPVDPAGGHIWRKNAWAAAGKRSRDPLFNDTILMPSCYHIYQQICKVRQRMLQAGIRRKDSWAIKNSGGRRLMGAATGAAESVQGRR